MGVVVVDVALRGLDAVVIGLSSVQSESKQARCMLDIRYSGLQAKQLGAELVWKSPVG